MPLLTRTTLWPNGFRADHDMAHRVDDLLLPIVKGVGSERAYEILTESLQTLGGSGFLVDYPRAVHP